MNQFNIIGNLGRDPELRYSAAGNAVCKFSVATKAGWGEKESTTWVNCVAFGKRGETIGKHFAKGQKIGLTGEIATSEYEKDGVTHRAWECVVRDFFFIESKGASRATASPEQDSWNDEDIPF